MFSPPRQVTTSTQGIVGEINTCDPLCLTWIHLLIIWPMLGAKLHTISRHVSYNLMRYSSIHHVLRAIARTYSVPNFQRFLVRKCELPARRRTVEEGITSQQDCCRVMRGERYARLLWGRHDNVNGAPAAHTRSRPPYLAGDLRAGVIHRAPGITYH